MAKAVRQTGRVNKIKIRMYRGGTGDFFILQFKTGAKVSFNMMIDCGCINGGKEHFAPRVADLQKLTGGVIDLLVVTHEHADHINGFEKAADVFKKITFKKVWFAWTESDEDDMANHLRRNYSELDKSIKIAVTKLNGLVKNKYYNSLYANEDDAALMVKGKEHFIKSLTGLNALNVSGNLGAKKGKEKPTMVELLTDFNVIKAGTEVECLEPGAVRVDLPGAKGIRFYVLGPPKNTYYLDLEHSHDGNFEKREKKSKVDFALMSALAAIDTPDNVGQLPFEAEHEKPGDIETKAMQKVYNNAKEEWRKIDYDWLFSAGSLAMRYEKSINNTSLALAIQFESSEKVLLFPGDAELGNWESWHDKLEWPVNINGQTVKRKAEYFLNKTVFYKVGHHMSQNGTPKGIDMMTSSEMTVMATLDFRKINDGWLNTMPNDLLGAELIKKSEGKFYFTGERSKIMPNIKTKRVAIKKTHEATLNKLNKPFDGKLFVECEIAG
jgi:hypothetical protein